MNQSSLRSLVIAALTLAGAVVGIFVSVRETAAGNIAGIGWPVTAIFFLLYCSGIVAGSSLLRGHAYGGAVALPFWIAQLPVVYSPAFAYYFGAGASLYVTVGARGSFSFDWFIGTHFGVFAGQPSASAIGVNVVAAIVVQQLYVLLRTGKRDSG